MSWRIIQGDGDGVDKQNDDNDLDNAGIMREGWSKSQKQTLKVTLRLQMLTVTESCLEEVPCWIYLLKKYKEEMLSLPMLSNYKSEDDHGRPYVPRCDREDLSNYYSDVQK